MAALNIINPKEIDHAVDVFKATAVGRDVQEWITTILKNYFKRTERFYREVSEVELSILANQPRAPEWLKEAVPPVHWFIYAMDAREHEEFTQALCAALDWWNHLPADSAHKKRWRKVSVEEAFALSEEWHKQLARKANDEYPEDWEGIKVVKELSDGFKAVQIISSKGQEIKRWKTTAS